MKATLEESLDRVEEWKSHFISELPKELSSIQNKQFQTAIAEIIQGAEVHVRTIYGYKLSLGPNLSGLIQHKTIETYHNELNGIVRHLEKARDIVKAAKSPIAHPEHSEEEQFYLTRVSPFI